MKKSLIIISLLCVVLTTLAIPAKRGQWMNITLADGTQVRAELRGDEHFRFFTDIEGNRYVIQADGTYVKASDQEVMRRQAASKARRTARMPQRRALKNTDTSLFQGEKKGLIILVEFSKLKFRNTHNLELYERIINERGYTSSAGFIGSVRDYFHDQSNGQFDLSFDVVGPVTLSHDYSYYGANDQDDNDKHPGEMVAEACKAVDDEIDFTTYDWDGDGVVEEVYVLYAGHGEADYYYYDSSVIWPHMFSLSSSDYGRTLKLDGVEIDVYACSNEIQADNRLAGIGTFCHEFSHCMGFPDAYDTLKDDGNYGLGSWDLMDYGSYNGDLFVPAAYSAYEKWECGWIDPVPLQNDTTVTDMKTLADGGEAYILRNPGYANEVYILENRQKVKWDSKLPGRGMLIHYVDYDPELWENNCPNGWEDYAWMYGLTIDHQHLTIVHADNKEGSNDESGDTYPYRTNNSFSATSTPAAKLWHANTDGSKVLNIAVNDITQNADGTMAFGFVANTADTPDDPDDPDQPVIDPDDEGYDIVFYESFNKCEGTGGNDGKYSGSIANYPFNPDFEGWVSASSSLFGADQCARFGTSTKPGTVTTPAFDITGEVELLFRAAAWGKDGTSLKLSVEGDATLSETDLKMKHDAWTNYLVTLTPAGTDDTTGTPATAARRAASPTTVTVTFTPDKRFFLDEVKVRMKHTDEPPVVDGIREVGTPQASALQPIYSLDGRYLGTDFSRLRPGMYIVGKSKKVKK